MAEKYYKISPYAYVANNPITTIDPDGRYLFGLFGSTSGERRMARAEKFAEKVGGTVRMDSKGKPIVGYGGASGDGSGVTVKTEKRFGDFSTWRNIGNTLAGFSRALDSGGTNYGNGDGEYTGKAGLKKVLKDAGSASTYVKGVGVLVAASSPVTGPEAFPIGVGIYDAGANMGTATTVISAATDLSGNNKEKMNGVVKLGSVALGAYIGGQIDAGVSNEATKFVGKAAADVIVDKAADKLIQE